MATATKDVLGIVVVACGCNALYDPILTRTILCVILLSPLLTRFKITTYFFNKVVEIRASLL